MIFGCYRQKKESRVANDSSAARSSTNSTIGTVDGDGTGSNSENDPDDPGSTGKNDDDDDGSKDKDDDDDEGSKDNDDPDDMDSNGKNDPDDDMGASGGGSPGTKDLATAPNYDYIAKADAFLESQKVQQTKYVDATGTHDVDPSAPFKNYTLNTYSNHGYGPLNNKSDVYDNGLAAIYYTVTGRATKAGEILSTYLRMYNYLANDPTAPKILSQRVDAENLTPDGSVEPIAYDLGNNSYMILALCKYYKQFVDNGATAQELQPYYDRAYKLVAYINQHHKRTGGEAAFRGFIGRNSYQNNLDGQGPFWQSNEHIINLYAVGNCMAGISPPQPNQGEDPYDTSILTEFRDHADNFVRNMFDTAIGAYRIGTPDELNANRFNLEDGVPADTQTWRILSGAGYISKDADKQSLDYLTTPAGANNASGGGNGSGGHWVVETIFGVDNFAGVRFTANNYANGQQTENTGAALLALLKDGRYSEKAKQIEESLKKFFDNQGNNGLPAHKENMGDINPACFQPTGVNCNTGLGWSYFSASHVASTVYSILGLINENPYSPDPSAYKRTEDVVTNIYLDY